MCNREIKVYVLSFAFFALFVLVILAGLAFQSSSQKGTTTTSKYAEAISPHVCKEGLPENNRTNSMFRFDERTKKCYAVNTVGPCGSSSNMIFVEKEGSSTFGTCDCDRQKSERFLIFDAKKNQCYFVFEQAYCKENEWLTLNKQHEPTCEINPCAKEAEENPDSVFAYLRADDEEEFKCRELEMQTDYCLQGQILWFKSGYVRPQCVKSSTGQATMPEVGDTVVCLPGATISQNNMCYKDVDFP